MSKDADWYGAFADLSARSRYNITHMTQKNHGCCGHTFAAVDGIIALRQQHKLSAANVKRITVGTYAKALEITGNLKPRTAFEAKFSLPYCVAVALLTGQVRLDAFSPERLADPQVREVMKHVELSVDSQLEAAFPRQRAATVEIETIEGKHFRHHSPTRKGDPDNPLTDEELSAKYRELVIPVIGEAAADQLLTTLWELEKLGDVTGLDFTGSGVSAAEKPA